MFIDYVAGFPAFAFYLGVGVAILVLVLFGYRLATPHDEIGLVKENNVAASIAIAGAIVGLALPIASASLNSVNLLDFAIWGVIGCFVQILAFFVAWIFLGRLPRRIEEGSVSAGVFTAGIAIAFGILNAASMVP